MSIRDLVKFAIFGLFVYLCVECIRPYFNNYWLSTDLQQCASFATMHGDKATENHIDMIMINEGWPFRGADFYIIKNIDGSATVGIEYIDDIRFFGYIITEIQFSAEKTKHKSKKYF